MDESTLVSHGQALNIRLSAVRHTPHIENDPRAPPQAYDKSAEKQLVVFCDYPEVVPNYPEVVKALPLAWIGTRPEPYEPRKNSHRWDTWWPRGGRRRLTGRVFWALIVIVVAAIVTAGVGLGLNLGMRHTGSDTSTPAASSTMAPAVPEVTSTSTPVTLLTMVLVVLEETGTSTPAALSTTSPAVPVASSTASTPNCQQGILYCGWDLIESHSTCYPNSHAPSRDPLPFSCSRVHVFN